MRAVAVLVLNFGVVSLPVACDGLVNRLVRCGLAKWAMRWTENCLDCRAPSTVVSSTETSWRPVHREVPWRSKLGQGMKMPNHNSLAAGTARTLSRSADGTKPSGAADTQDVPSFRGIRTGWRNGPAGTSWGSTWGSARSCTWGGTTPDTSTGWGPATCKAACKALQLASGQ